MLVGLQDNPSMLDTLKTSCLLKRSFMFILKKEMTECTSFTVVNSAVTGSKITKLTHNVAKSSQMNF